MFLLQLRQLPHVMPFAGGENQDQTGERRERKESETKHDRAKIKGRARKGATKRSGVPEIRASCRYHRKFLLARIPVNAWGDPGDVVVA